MVIIICVMIHEGGHYFAAVWRGVQVHEFAFGMGPAVMSRKARSGTRWSLRLFPIGGFVRMEGEEDEPHPGDVPDAARSFMIKRAWEKFVIVAGGAAMNIVLAWILTAFLLSFSGVSDLKSPVVGRLIPGYPAAGMGALPGDRVLSINGQAIAEWSDIRKTLVALATDEVEIVVRRGDAEITLSGTVPVSPGQDARLWGVQPSTMKYPFYKAAWVGMNYCWSMSVQILTGLWRMITGAMEPNVAGPVGIAVMAGDAARQGFWTFVMFLAVINLNLGLLNLLPLPALDGGRLVFILGEAVSGRRFPEKWENRIHLLGFALLLVLIVLVTWKDIQNYLIGN
jgi:regulator of sigma E protease